jgi:hypothetical protein
VTLCPASWLREQGFDECGEHTDADIVALLEAWGVAVLDAAVSGAFRAAQDGDRYGEAWDTALLLTYDAMGESRFGEVFDLYAEDEDEVENIPE